MRAGQYGLKTALIEKQEADAFPARIIRFADLEVDLSRGIIRKAGLETRIQAKPLEILRLLLSADGRTLTREELRVALWPENTFVDFEHGLNTAVKKLRKALEDSAENPNLIQTIPKIGYRFIGSVEWVLDSPGQKETGAMIAKPDANAAHSKRRVHRLNQLRSVNCAARYLQTDTTPASEDLARFYRMATHG